MENLFEYPNTYNDREKLAKDASKIDELAKGELTLNNLSQIIYIAERIALSSRTMMQKKKTNETINDEFSRIEKDNKYQESFYNDNFNLPVTVKRKGDIVHIYTPYTFKRGMKESYYLADYLDLKLISLKDQDILNFNRQKVVVAIVRVAEKYNPNRHCDNDNLETTELINIIFRHMALSDNPEKMSYLTDFITSNNPSEYGLHIFVYPYEEKASKFINQFKNNEEK